MSGTVNTAEAAMLAIGPFSWATDLSIAAQAVALLGPPLVPDIADRHGPNRPPAICLAQARPGSIDRYQCAGPRNGANRPTLDNSRSAGPTQRRHGIVKATDTITVIESYDAVRLFLEAVWRRHGNCAEDIEFIVGGAKWADGAPVDPAMWQDWLAAVEVACKERTTIDQRD